jgi:GDP/UDP-N,N'-diacetylbacillosamine 2-epimerase (hydrolysing)
MKTICVVTGSRADYGLLYWPMKEIINQGMKLKLVVTGSHLSAKHGRTIEAIKADGFAIDSEVDIKINGDRPVDICESMGEAISRFSKYFEANRPDFLLILGDRYEIFSVVQAAMVHNIPIGHIHGGEVTEGAIDDVIRHSITKLSSLHFTSAEEYRQRVIQLGEHPSTVFKVGAPGLDNIKRLKLLSRKELEDNLGCTFNKTNILITFHPVTLSEKQTIEEATNFFNAMEALDEGVSFFITMPNADTYSNNILKIIEEFRSRNAKRTYHFTNLGQLRYLSLMNHVDLVAGNSSSGIIEAPFLHKSVLDIGDRQKGRLASKHVLHANGSVKEILEKAKIGLSKDFQQKLPSFPNLYGDGESGKRIADVLSKFDFSQIKNKVFYDLKMQADTL